MFLIPLPSMHPLISGLKQMPEDLTLAEFKDRLRELFLQIYQSSPGFFAKGTETVPESFMSKLAKAFECDPTLKKPPKAKNEALNGSIRTIRHMIYNHEAIKDLIGNNDGQKKILIPNLTRLQILLAKRLSTLRIIKEQREFLLRQEVAELETLLTLEDQDLKARISEGVSSKRGKRNRIETDTPRSAQPLWRRRGHSVYRLALTRGVIMEIDDRMFRDDNHDAKQAALSKYLEAMFNIEADSETSKDLIAKVIKASSSPNGKTTSHPTSTPPKETNA